MINHQFRLAARPIGLPKSTDWQYTKETINDIKTGEILIEVLYISLDPAMRGWIKEGKSYIEPVKLGEVMRALCVGQVVASKHEEFAVKDHVSGVFGVQEYMVADGKNISKIDTKLVPLPIYLSVLGMTGMTAYFGLLEIGKPKAGETVVVSGAAGAVGSLVGQIAKIKGCRVIGIAGGAEKCRYLKETLGFDESIDYKNEEVMDALKKYCPKGINIYFDNVGGDILDACLSLLAQHARVVLCGAISQYNNTGAIKGPANYLSLLVNRANMQGFIVFDYANDYQVARTEMAALLAAGKIKSHEDIVSGLQAFPETFLKLFKGENLGKLMIKVR